MWALTHVFDRVCLPNKRRMLMERIRSFFEIPTMGIAFVMDDSDCQDNNRLKGRSGATINIERGGVDEYCPWHLQEVMEQDYSHLIWMSRSACVAFDIDFAWVLAHELRHLEQNLDSYTLVEAGSFLARTLIDKKVIDIEEPRVQAIVPTEFDAHLAAWRIVRILFGTGTADLFVQKGTLCEEHDDSFRVLLGNDPERPYDVYISTAGLLRKYQTQLEELKQECQNAFIRDFDINAVCRELSKGRGRSQ